MRSLPAAAGVALLAALTGACNSAADTKVSPTAATAADAKDKAGKGSPTAWAGMKSTAPASWKEVTPSNSMRKAQFSVPKAAGDKDDGEIVVFEFPGGGGVDANVKRQTAAFQPPAGKDKAEEKQEKIKVGENEGVLHEITGTLLKKTAPFDPNSKTTAIPGYKQLYVVFETKDGITASAWFRGPEKTVGAHRKEFVDWVKGFK